MGVRLADAPSFPWEASTVLVEVLEISGGGRHKKVELKEKTWKNAYRNYKLLKRNRSDTKEEERDCLLSCSWCSSFGACFATFRGFASGCAEAAGHCLSV